MEYTLLEADHNSKILAHCPACLNLINLFIKGLHFCVSLLQK
uniref:Uncharacterized protein n=1 Tax=Anguilla anguilla TaxID=7936 RepID=A0A0E9RTM9_ANGAN